MRSAHWMMAAALAVGPMCSSWAIEGDGLMPARDAEQELHWQGRLSLGTLSPLMRSDTSIPTLGSMSLLGDYYFSAPPSLTTGNARGFRATSGLFIGARATSLLSVGSAANLGGRSFSVDRRSLGAFSLSPGADTSSTDPAATPYFGFGYSGLASKRWGFSADVGVMALNPGSAVKLGRVVNGNQSLDDVLREMRLSPLVQVGVSYSF